MTTPNIIPDDLAARLAPYAGLLFKPTSPRQAIDFTHTWCEHCSLDDYDPNIPESGCKILGAFLRHLNDSDSYHEKIVIGNEGQPICTAFQPPDSTPRCEHTADFFEQDSHGNT